MLVYGFQNNIKPGRYATAPSPIAPVSDVFRAVVSTLIPPASDLQEAEWQKLHELVASALKDRPPALQRQLRVFLRLIQWLPVLRFGRTFKALPADKRARFLSWLERHPVKRIRVGFWGLRALAFIGYYGQPQVGRELGYRPHARGWDAWNA